MTTSRKLIITRGLPGSGKSTWAEAERTLLESKGFKTYITNKDTIRKTLIALGWKWSPENEKDVLKTQNHDIKAAFNNGYSVVIVADCNFGKHKDRLYGLAMYCNADFEVKDFTSVPLETCIERDSKRQEEVGAEVITKMYNDYLSAPEPKIYTPDVRKPRALICDLDGTLALHNGKRSPYDYNKVDLDTLNEPVAELLRAYAGYKNFVVIYLSGREDSCRYKTEDWLQRMHVPTDPPHILLMRKEKDHRKDYIVKQEIFDQYIRDNYWVRFALDDQDQVVKMWRELGLPCWQVNYGNF
jgi:predicted kinase